MKYVNWVILKLFLCVMAVGCAGRTVYEVQPVSCNVKQTDTGATYTCPNGSTVNITNGTNGTNGHDGSSLSFMVNPSTPTECPGGGEDITIIGETSSVTTPICNGVEGHNGNNGSNGRDGRDGIDAASISVVQFCSGVATYPNKFPEIGLCIGGNMYGVYSKNDGFMAYLPPGRYESHGINSSCTFTIQTNCGVTLGAPTSHDEDD